VKLSNERYQNDDDLGRDQFWLGHLSDSFLEAASSILDVILHGMLVWLLHSIFFAVAG
jgi:hypothetical protein